MRQLLLKGALIAGAMLALSACGMQRSLYSWHAYNGRLYNYVDKRSPKSLEALVGEYEKIIERQSGLRKMPPPGICAEYGYLLLQKGEKEKGLAMLELEIQHYPESKVFIQRIIEQHK